jgi:hypothetical protein
MRSCKLLSILCLALVCGCTYSFRGQTTSTIKSLAIPTFENESSEFGLAENVTDQLVRAFQQDGLLRITSQDQADAVLHGRIVRVEDMPYTAQANQTVQEYRFSVSCEIDLINAKTNETMWSQPFNAWAIYPYDGSLAKRDGAIQEAVGKLQADLLNKIVGSW